MTDISLKIDISGGRKETVGVPGDMQVAAFLPVLLETLYPSSNNGFVEPGSWVLIHEGSKRPLNAEKTLNGNGLRDGDVLILEKKERLVVCRHCHLENLPENNFCYNCGKPLRDGAPPPAKDMRLYVHVEDQPIMQVSVRDDATHSDVVSTVIGAGAGDEWELFDHDTDSIVDPAKRLTETGVIENHTLHLRRKPRIVEPKPEPRPEIVVEETKADAGSNAEPRIDVVVVEPPKPPKPPKPPFQHWTAVVVTLLLLLVAGGAAELIHKWSSIWPAANPVAITPSQVDLAVSRRQQFAGTISGQPGQFNWSIEPKIGNITTTGLYTAPGSVAEKTTVTVHAVNKANPRESATGSITLEPGRASMQVSPDTASLMSGQSVKLSASSSDGSNTGVRWSIQPAVGSIAPDGTYTAPTPVSSETSVSITATAINDAAVVAAATIQLKPATIWVSPENTTLNAGARMRLNAGVDDTPNRGIRWTLSGPGTLGQDGTYVAPAAVMEGQAAVIKAISAADPTTLATAIVKLKPVIAISAGPAGSVLGASQRVNLVASVTGAVDTSVRWTLSGSGTVQPNGTYIAPAVIPAEEQARVTAASVADPTKTATVVVSLHPLTLIVNPASVEVSPAQQVKFTAAISYGGFSGVHWTLTGPGKLLQDGTYIAPPIVSTEQNVRITAASTTDPGRTATAVVHLKRYAGPTSGTLVWTGKLQKNGTVTIDDAGASVGNITGAKFPAVPIFIKVEPAKDFAIVQPPSPLNGWTRVTLQDRKGKQATVRITWVVINIGGQH